MRDSKEDLLYYRVCEYVLSGGRVSVTHLQLKFGVGFYQAYGWIVRMEENGIIALPKGRLH
jgi:DNA segregation ATPase FtsK/SpoIIIE-like protein